MLHLFMKTKITHKELREAIKELVYKGVISQDKDVYERLGYTKGTVSAYLSGKTVPSEAFIEKFEEVFKVNLTNQTVKTNIMEKSENGNDRTDELIATLKDQVAWLKSSRDEKNVYIEELREKIKDLQQNLKDVRSHNETLKHEVLLNLETVLGNQIVQEAAMEARQDTILEELLKGKPFEERLRVYETVDKRVLELGSEYDGKDMHLKTGSLYRKLT